MPSLSRASSWAAWMLSAAAALDLLVRQSQKPPLAPLSPLASLAPTFLAMLC